MCMAFTCTYMNVQYVALCNLLTLPFTPYTYKNFELKGIIMTIQHTEEFTAIASLALSNIDWCDRKGSSFLGHLVIDIFI